MAQLKPAFEISIKKMQRPDKLERTDKVVGEVPVLLQPEFEDIRTKNEEITDPELWNVESLAFRYFNILHLYKTNKQVRNMFPILFFKNVVSFSFIHFKTNTVIHIRCE